MKRSTFTMVFFLASLVLALVAKAAETQLTETFNIDGDPGEGALTYVQGTKSETIALGKEAGRYAFGLAFQANNLPSPYKDDFKNNLMLQLAFGAMKGRAGENLPQFGAATLIVGKIPTSKVILRLLVPAGKDATSRNSGILMFASPSTQASQSDEEKVKATFFASGGTLSLTPVGSAKLVQVQSGGKSYPFKSLKMAGEFIADLTTPFQSQVNKLSGKFQFNLFYPEGKESDALTTKIATESMGGNPELVQALEPAKTERAVSTRPAPKTPAKRASKKAKPE